MDEGTGLSILGTAIGSAKMLEKLLGPTAEYLGGNLRDWTKKRVENLGKIFQDAEKKLGEGIDKEGSVPPKVLKNILADGTFSDDRLSVEYFGGVLASSRSEVPRDDRGAAFAALVGRLTTYQIRSHYFFYNLWRAMYLGEGLNVGVQEDRAKMQIYIPMDSYAEAMELSEKEDLGVVLSHTIVGLLREALIDNNYLFGSLALMAKHFPEATRPGVIVAPSSFGVELFHWAHGRGDLPVHRFLDPTVELKSDVQIRILPGVRGTKHKGNDAFRPPQPGDPGYMDLATFTTFVSPPQPPEE